MVGTIKMGSPEDFTNFFNAVIDEKAFDKISGYIAAAKDDPGVEIIAGGGYDKSEGYFIEPTILVVQDPKYTTMCEELFGPVAIVIRAQDEDDALRIANDSRFGLGGSVWTSDSERGETFARKLACGCAFVNGLVKSDPRLPFGGIKASGFGRELSIHGIREFVNVKSVWIK